MQPQPFGLYTLIHRINVGGMAEVFKACYYDNGRPAFAAIKRILPHLAQDRSFIDMFITEAHTAGRLVHANIAQIIEQGEEEGEYYISMEYISGRDLLYLRHHLKERGMFLPPALAAYVMMCVAEALDYAHRLCDPDGQHLEIIHRDVSPQNILISYSGEVKLIDFGIAKAKIRTQEHTRAGVLKGKFGYMAPEQVKGHAIDHRTDIFALGTVFYELLTNQRLFMGNSDIETLEMVREARVVPPSTINEWIPPQLDQIILYALQPDPQHRFQSAGDFAQALSYYLQQEAPMTHQNTLKAWMGQEFSTFIAHEKAQDSFLLEQMVQNIEDQQEDLDSTSLISADAIALLNQYTAQELGSDTASQLTPEYDQSDDQTGPINYNGNQWNRDQHQRDTVPPQTNADQSHQDNTANQAATRQVEAQMYQGLAANIIPAPHTPFLSQQDLKTDDSLDEQHLENLLEESLDDEEDESEISVVRSDLDHILAHSLTHGQRSPLTPSPFSQAQELSAEPTPVPSQSAHPQNIRSSTALSSRASSSSAVDAPLPHAGLFSMDEPTPVPSMRGVRSRSSSDRSNSKMAANSLKLALILILLAGVGGGGWWFMQAPASVPITLELKPFEKTTLQVASLSPIAGQSTQVIPLTGAEEIVIRHPDFPAWRGKINPSELPQKTFAIDLEKNAPHHPLTVLSNPPGAEVWVYGILRGKTPFKGQIPLNARGSVYVEVRYPGKNSRSKTISPKGKKPLFYYARF